MKNYLYLNIRTHRVSEFEDLSEVLRENWSRTPRVFNLESGLYPEYSKVVGIGLSYEGEEGLRSTYVQSENFDEVSLLNSISYMFSEFSKKDYKLCGYNISGFDIPFLMKRYVINNIKLPPYLRRFGINPWSFGDVNIKSYYNAGGTANLEEMAAACGIITNSILQDNFSDCWDKIDKEALAAQSLEINRVVVEIHNRIYNLSN